MDALFLVMIIIAVVGPLVYKNKRYRETVYYQITKTPYWFMDKGTRGEYLIYKNLQHFENDGGKFLFNVYLPKRNNETSEIDVLLLSSKGIFVFESKNYSGWIFGNEMHRYWTQTFPLGKGRSRKEKFYNPIMQNASHITCLRPYIGENTPVWSIIVFSDQCILKDITIRSSHVHVVHRYDVASVLAKLCDQAPKDVLTEIEIDDIYNRLYLYTQATNEIKEQHIKIAQSHFKSN